MILKRLSWTFHFDNNPYICKWQGQKGYVPVEECGTYSKKTGFVPDKAKIAEFNKQIWGEDGD